MVDFRATSSTQQTARLHAASALFDALTDAVVAVDSRADIINLNPAAQTMFGLGPPEADDSSTGSLPSEISACLVDVHTQLALQTDGKWQGECALVRNDTEIIIDLQIVHITRETDVEPFTLIIARDMTVLRRSERLAIESEQRFRRMADAAPVLIWQSGPDAMCNYFNLRWLEFTGRTIEEELDNGWSKGVHTEDFDRCIEHYSESFKQQVPFQMDYRLRRHDGVYRWILDSGMPRYSTDGSFEGYVGSCIDITEHKDLETMLQSQADKLMQLTTRKDEFLATLSHELRNPLSPISSALAVIRRFDKLDPLLGRNLDILERQVENLRRLVNDLLDIARIQSGKINLSKAVVPLNEVVDRALEISRPKIEQGKHRLSVRKAPGSTRVFGDPMRLAQTVSNILNNAAKFTPPSGTITVQAGEHDDLAFIAVADNGAGISKEFQPRLFDLFSQADESLARTQSGLGIGLAIANQIISLHDGSIEVRSEGVGLGSEFIVKLPIADKETATMQQETADDEKAPAHHDFKVLLVDDNEDANESMAALLELIGYQVRTATDGATALEVAAEFEPQLILSDIGLPGMDGYQLAPALRKAAGERKVIIAAATGYGHASDRLRSQAAGFDHHLVKPLDADTLLSFVAQQAAAY